MLTALQATARVTAGARLLDQHGPDRWRNRIQIDRFDMRSGTWCVLGQTYGDRGKFFPDAGMRYLCDLPSHRNAVMAHVTPYSAGCCILKNATAQTESNDWTILHGFEIVTDRLADEFDAYNMLASAWHAAFIAADVLHTT